MRKIYLSGRMSGMLESEYTAQFAGAEAFYTACGYQVVNPVILAKELEESWWKSGRKNKPGYSAYLRYDLKVLKSCDAIAMLDGWQRSKGAKIELESAKKNGLQVCFFRNEDLQEETA